MDKVLDFLIFLFNYCKNVLYGLSIVWLRKFKKNGFFCYIFKILKTCICVHALNKSHIVPFI